MQSPTSTNSDGDSIKKIGLLSYLFGLFGLLFDLYIFFKENWKLVLSISTIICWFTVWAYFNHFNRLDLFIELIRNSKTDLIYLIFPFILICLSLLIILNITGWLCVIYLKLFDFDNNKHNYKWIMILITIVASMLPLLLVLLLSEACFFKIDNFINLAVFGCMFIFLVIKFYFEVKQHKCVKKVNILLCFISLFFFPYTIFRIMGMKFMFYFVGGELTITSTISILIIALIFTLISLIHFWCYLIKLNEDKPSDQPDLNYDIIKKSFWTSIGALVLMFIILNKTFVYSSYAALRLLGVVDLNSVYEFSLVKNDVTVMKLANNEWDFNYKFNDQISVTGNIGFHLGDIYFICKEGAKKIFMDSLRYNLEKHEINPFDNKLCISFNKNDINIVQIKTQNNNQQSTKK